VSLIRDDILLDSWCALNSSFGGPLLAIVTVGGFLYVGRSLVGFPAKDSTSPVADRNRNNRRRGNVMKLGMFTAVLLFVNVIAYVCAFGSLRTNDKVCTLIILPAGSQVFLLVFFLITLFTAVVGSIYFKLLNDLKLTLPT
jgi:hypothetical protein